MKKLLKRILKTLYKKLAVKKICSYSLPLYINKPCNFNRNTFLGNNCHFNGIDIRGGGKVTISDNFHSGSDLLILTDVHNYNGDALPYDATKIIKDVTIGKNVWVGTRVTILGGVDIGDGAIIQAGAVVSKSIPPLSIAGGNPAAPFRYRNSEHYKKLESKGSYF